MISRIKEIEAECGRPAGSFLKSLAKLNSNYFQLGIEQVTSEAMAQLRREHDIIAIGRAANGYFGVIETELRETVDQSPVAYADRQQMPPEVAGANLSDFMTILSFFPDFFST